MDMIDKQMRSLVQEYRNNVINGNIDTINPEEIERIKKGNVKTLKCMGF